MVLHYRYSRSRTITPVTPSNRREPVRHSTDIAGSGHGQGQPGGVLTFPQNALTMAERALFPTESDCWLAATKRNQRRPLLAASEEQVPLAPASSSGALFGLAMGCRWVDSIVPAALSRCRQPQQLAHGGAAVVPALCAFQLCTDMESRFRCNGVRDGPSEGRVSQWCKRSLPPAVR